MIEMELVGVRVELPGPTPIVLLKENNERGLLLPIFIGRSEANAIDMALRDQEPPRPLTHDLFKITLDQLEAELTKVVVTEISDKTFFAELHLSTKNGDLQISSRSSDAIALAMRMQSPIYVEEDVLDKAGYILKDEESSEPEDNVLSEFRDFLEEVTPDDFIS